MKKEILMVHHYGGIGGGTISFIDLIESMDLENYNLTVLIPISSPFLKKYLIKNKNITILEVDYIPTLPFYSGGPKYIFSFNNLKNYFLISKLKSKITKIIVDSNPDILLVNSMTLSWLALMIKEKNLKTICFNRETYIESKLGIRKMIIQKLLSYFDKVIFISQYDLKKSYRVKSNKSVIYDKVSTFISDKENVLKTKNNNDNINYILYLGGHNKIKGPLVVYKLAKKIKENTKILFVGKEKNYLDKLKFNYKKIWDFNNIITLYLFINKSKIKDKIIFEESNFNLENLFLKSKIIIFPSIHPHQARPIYEAGLYSCVPIVTNFENTNEFVKHNQSGFTFEKNNVNELYNQIEYVLDPRNENHVNSIIKNNKIKMSKNHHIKLLPFEIKKILNDFDILKEEECVKV
ncbi:MAG: hypothetical protein C0425_10825 [Chlorobiaceae bacterium]|nr:hypothetical protein [Chlorobiaceae bacterium]